MATTIGSGMQGDDPALPCRLCRKPWPLAYLWEIGPGLYYCDFCLDQYGGDPPQCNPNKE